jgi:mannose-6-phosphate isomerase-like protein (cupin superfamily)
LEFEETSVVRPSHPSGGVVVEVIRRAASMSESDTPERCFITERWNRDDDPTVSLAQARIEPGVVTQLHALDGIAERYLILDGHGWVEVDGSRHDVEPGDVVHIPPGTAQRASASMDGDLVILCVCTPRFQLSAYRALGE